MNNQTPPTNQTPTNSTTHTTDGGALGNVRSKINDGIDSATNRIGDAVEGKANSIAARTQELLTSVAHSGQYLRESEPKTLGADLVAVVKRHPMLTLAMGAGLGIFVAKFIRR